MGTMPDDPHGPRKLRARLWLILAALVVLLALIFVPPFISLNHYRTRVTSLVSTALGRPVRLSNIELRLLPRPGFLLTDLTVQEEPDYGAEPVLHASEVKASIRLSALWSGKLQISRISVDDASLNLVRMPDGRWNLDSLFRNAAAGSQKASSKPDPPYLEATNSRINIKDGIEKLPFSILSADASMWRESNGNWRVRLRGQPARTDVSLDLADTGIIRLEANLRPAPQLNQMPLHVDVDWREAQLGQLSRILLSSDQGWRGDLTGELHIDGTIASAKVQSRLRASGVHRAEFAPAEPMDFDAACAFTLEYNQRSLQNLVCNSPVGEGRARLTGNLTGDAPGNQPGNRPPHLTLELDRVPAQAGLDLLRTMRSNIDPSLQAAGFISGRMTFDRGTETAGSATPAPHKSTGKPARVAPAHAIPNPLSGAFTVTGLSITGNALNRPIQVAGMTLEPAPLEPGQPVAVFTSASIPAGAPAPLSLTARLALRTFQLGIHGSATIPRLREFASVAGSSLDPALGQISGGAAALDLTADGPWVPPADVLLSAQLAPARRGPAAIQTNGTVSLHDVAWKSGFLANPVQIASATLHLEENGMRWDPVDFSYGPVSGNATLNLAEACEAPAPCAPKFTVHFGELNAKMLQAALLGAKENETVLSSLLARISPAPPWPDLDGRASADSLVLGTFKLTDVSANLHIHASGTKAASFDAGLLGGTIHGTASLDSGDKPVYKLDAATTGLSPAEVGRLAAMRWSGGTLDAAGTLQLTGYSEKDLLDSATGSLHFNWGHGAIAAVTVPPSLSHFDLWIGDASVSHRTMSVKASKVRRGKHTTIVNADVTFGIPAKVSFSSGTPPRADAK
jgi:hypothetical protein